MYCHTDIDTSVVLPLMLAASLLQMWDLVSWFSVVAAVDHFYILLFSTLEQTYHTLVICDSE